MRRSIKTKNGRNRKNFIFFKKGKREKSKSISEMTISMVQSIHIPLLVIAIILLSFILCNNDNINIFKINSHSDIENIDEKIIEIGQKGKISSATIIDTSTGTGPWDENDDPGNDSSEDNNIVRSFDQVRWTVDLTMALKEETVESGLTGGVIEVDIQLSEQCANVVNWDLSSMNWLENGTVSDDGTRLTGKYSMTENETTIPGKQTLVFVLQVEGAENKTEIVPTFKFKLTGNNEEDKITITGEKVIVSAKGKYNIQLHSNTGNLSNKTTVDYGSGETEGRMYGYGFTVQLYNESSSKGLKGIEAPKGDVTFDIDLKLERSKFGSTELEDITDDATPILWNYRANDWASTLKGNISGRDMYRYNVYSIYDSGIPLGNYYDDEYSTYNSGNINIVQEGSKLKVTITDYEINGIFPLYASSYSSNINRTKIYTENIGTFSVGYIQIFVPDTPESTVENRNYYLTISDQNMNIEVNDNETIIDQMKTSDDNIKTQHVLYKPGSYSQSLMVYDEQGKAGSVESFHGTGDGKASVGQKIRVNTKFVVGQTNDFDIYTANKFVKFDGEGFEPLYFSNNDQYRTSSMNGNAKFKVWYVTKKDGTNWTSRTEMTNANIEDMDIYESIEDIPNEKICVGIYFETISGYISRLSGDNNILMFLLKIKDTAIVGKTYGIMQRTTYWKEELDRNIYTITNQDVEWPTPTWDFGNREYIKTEYSKDGEIISGTHSGGSQYGNTILVVGANLHGDIRAIENNKEKINYDLGKNENIVTYSVEPQLDSNVNLASQISNVTLKAEVTIPKELEYIAGSSKRGDEAYTEPEIIENQDGSKTLVWYLYSVTSGEEIEPILFNAQINNESENGIQYTAQLIVSEVIGEDGIPKIGNSKIDFRTSTETINIINLASHRLYKETITPVIEKNSEMTYTIIYENKTENHVDKFQLLDILPYNGDGRGTSYNGAYTLKEINISQTIDGELQTNDNLSLYTTSSEEVRNIDSKDTGIGIDDIWSETILENATGIALKGRVEGKTRIEIEITIKTENNQARNTYANSAMAQVYSDSEQMVTGSVTSQVVYRQIQGKIWEDTNKNGIIDNNEIGMENIKTILINTETQEEKEILTDANGDYEFEDLEKGKYKIRIEGYGEEYCLTEKEVGTNQEINSKFNEETSETDEITRLNNISSPEILEENINGGLKKKEFKITTKVEGEGGNISGKDETPYEEVEYGKNSVKDIIITPDYGYKVNYITVNGAKIEFTENADHTVELDKFINMLEDKEVVVKFEKIGAKVIVHHYIENSTEKVPSSEPGKVIEDEILNGYVGEEYETKQADNLAPEYILVDEPENKDGTYEENTIVVTYYYTIKEIEIIEETLVKTGTDEITSVSQKVSYQIHYNAVLDDYKGTAVLTIKDTLPYEINEEESKLDDGVYDKETKTITWTIDIGNIDTYTNGEKTIDIIKYVEVLYVGIDTLQDSMLNEVTTKLDLPATNATLTKEAEKETLINTRGKVVVKYIDRYTKEEIETRVTKTGKVGEEFDVSGDMKTISGYTLVKEPDIKTGKYTEEEQEKIYYYAKNTSVHVTYVDKMTGQEIAEDITITGYEKLAYKTEKKEIDNFTYLEDTGNTEGEMTRSVIEVIYYYLQKTSVRVEHIDKIRNQILDTERIGGLEGDKCETSAKDFNGYVLVEEPEQKTVTMTKNEIVVRYYYAHISAGVIEKHIDEITGEVLYEDLHEGKEGDKYSTKEKEFTGYDLVKDKYPTNAQGTMSRESIEVKYYYKKRASVRVEHIDKITGDKLTTDTVINGHEGDDYTTSEKQFEGYDLVELPSNATGKMKVTLKDDGTYETEVLVQYYYIYNSAGVLEKHVDEISGKILAEEKYTGYEGDKYETYEKEFEGYKLMEEKYPENAEGTMKKELIEVTYYYRRKAEVKVEHIDKYTGSILDKETIRGVEGENYKTEEKEFTGYDYIEVVGEASGKMNPDEEIIVRYYYLKQAKVITQYLEEGTELKLAIEEVQKGHEGDTYTTNDKNIEYYTLVGTPENYTGEMKGTIYVTYYYNKKNFNLSIDKVVTSLKVNGEDKKIQDKDLVKTEINEDKIDNTNIEIEYSIEVSNKGEIAGKATILEKIPEYLNMSKESNNGWVIEGDEARYETEEIAPGESKTYKVVMTWEKGSNNFGTLKNIATIEETENAAGFEETNLEDNTDEAEVIITVATGIERISVILLLGAIFILAVIYRNRKMTLTRGKIAHNEEEKDNK